MSLQGPASEEEGASTGPSEPAGGPTHLGNYQLTRRIARGGMGEVYLARLVGELGFEKELVIKTILPELAADPRFIELFAAEAKTAVALSHGNIVPTYELGRAGETFYIAMGYVDGPSTAQLLERLVARGQPPNIEAALFIIRGVLSGLAYAHREDPGRTAVVHRDISPRNVLLDKGGQIRIVDFGIAAPAKRAVGVRAGSIGYVAPEQARGDAADPRADVFSVGCLLYELLTHTRAFPKEGVWVTPDLGAIPEGLREPLGAALSTDVSGRPADAAALLSSLRAAFTTLGGTFDDASLALHVQSLFPDGWHDGLPLDSSDDERRSLEGPNETYATRLTAITGVDVALQGDGGEELTPPASAPPPSGPSPMAAVSQQPTAHPSRGRIAILALGALTIGGVAFAMGRTKTESPRPTAPTSASSPASTAPPTSGTNAPTTAILPPPVDAGAEQPRDAANTTSLPVREDPLPGRAWSFDVRPETARVIVDGGDPLEGPPFVVQLPSEGESKVVITADGYLPRTLQAAAGATLPGQIRLAAKPPRDPGSLQVFAPSVPWAEVRVDGKKIGNTPTRKVSLVSGRHRVEVRCVPEVCTPARVLYKKSVSVDPGRLTRIDVPR